MKREYLLKIAEQLREMANGMNNISLLIEMEVQKEDVVE